MSPPQPEAPPYPDRLATTPVSARRPQARGQPPLRIPRLNLAHLADVAVTHQLAGEHDHREAGVGVGNHERDFLRSDGGMQPSRLVQGRRQRLLAQHGDAGVGRRLGGPKWASLGVTIVR